MIKYQDAHDYRFIQMDVTKFTNHVWTEELKNLMNGYKVVSVTPLGQPNMVLLTLEKVGQ